MSFSYSIHLQHKSLTLFTSQKFTSKIPFFPLKKISSIKTRSDNTPHYKTVNSIKVGRCVGFLGSVLPGGSWWKLPRGEDVENEDEKSVSVVEGVRRMWSLLGDDGRCAVCFGVLALVVAAVSEISMPRILAESIFSAQGGEAILFRKNIEVLVILCVTSGISSGLRSACFGVADALMVKHFRESLFSKLVFQVLALLLGGTSILTGQISIEELTKYILYCEWLIYATWRLVDNLSLLMQSIGASEKLFHLENLLPSDQLLSKGVKLQKLKGYVHFANVSFYYPTRLTVPVLQDVNFSIEANEVVAIVGPNGSGKSTLINLLLRLYEPTDGQIYIDGTPLENLDIRWLRQKIGVVRQEPDLLHMDIKSNISYGFSGNFEDIERAAKKAYVHEFISSLPSGYDTYIDDKLLSGGQKQRIAIARAIFRDPAVLIFDEATSGLDPESEHYVKAVLESFREAKRTVIVVAHRLSTIKAANRIIVLERGQVVEMGDYRELLLKDGYLSHFVEAQTDSVSLV